MRPEACAAYERYIALHPDDAEIAHILVSLRDEAPPPRASDHCIKQLYARFAGFYDENMSQYLEYLAPARLSEAVEPLLQGRSELDVLDLGCGTGLCGQRLRRLARRLVGVDLSAPMIAQAQARCVYDALDAAEITAWLDHSITPQFDVITACDSLIYFGDLRQVLEPAARRLAPGGLLAFTLERGNRAPFQLTDSGRFTHHADHVRSAALAAGLVVARFDEATIRYEYGKAVVGLVVVLRQPALSGASTRLTTSDAAGDRARERAQPGVWSANVTTSVTCTPLVSVL